jgi:WD40 repeat protein
MTGSEVITITHPYPVGDVTFSPDGRYFATAGLGGDVRVFETSTGSELIYLPDAGVQVIFNPNGQLATAGYNNVKLWSEEGWQLFATLPHSRLMRPAYSLDGRYIFTLESGTTGYGNIVNIWETETGNRVFDIPHDYGIWSVALSPDGKYVATGSGNIENGIIQVWDILNDRQILQLLQNSGINAITFSPNGQYLAFEIAEDAISVWNLKTQQETARFGRTAYTSVLSFSSDSSQLLVMSGGTDVYLLRWNPADLIAEACTRLSRNLTPAEWNTYLGDQPYRPTCPNLPIPEG